MRTLKIVYLYSINSLQQTLSNLSVFFVFLLAKILRYGMFLLFLFLLVNGVVKIGGYSPTQMLTFYLVFNLVDTTTQMLFREVYRFRGLVSSGEFDFVLSKPLHPLIRSLLGGPDFIDSGMLIILLAAIVYLLTTAIHPSFVSVALFSALIINTIILSAAFHIIVLGIGILTLSVDHLIMIYRDLTALVRIPVDLYINPLRTLLTFVIPIGIMFTFPAKAVLGILSWKLVLISFVVGLGAIWISLIFWGFAVKHYQSASS